MAAVNQQFEQQYGFFRLYVKQVIYRYLDCGVLKNGFARVRCENCDHEYLNVFACDEVDTPTFIV